MSRSREHLKKDVVEQLLWDSRVDAADVLVGVSGSRVTLSGTVPSPAAREAAGTDAISVAGVAFVDNQLKVKYPDGSDKPADQHIESIIMCSFRGNPNFIGLPITVSVDKGVVTLEGSVDTFWKKKRAESVAYDVRGTVDVVNTLFVVPTRDISDEAIANDIAAVIERSPYVDAQTLDVEVAAGAVTLRGKVPNWIAVTAACDAAMYTAGVKEVKNELTL
jgi:osmotically-inducible protein OsmY